MPALGTSLLVASTVLIGIAVPPALREALATSRLFTEENCHRVRALLTQAGLSESGSARLASRESLKAGQQVLRQQCVECHDLRTVLARPRTPEAWRQTVSRMADRTTPVEKKPPSSEADARALVARMVEEGLTTKEDELALIASYLADTYAKKPKP